MPALPALGPDVDIDIDVPHDLDLDGLKVNLEGVKESVRQAVESARASAAFAFDASGSSPFDRQLHVELRRQADAFSQRGDAFTRQTPADALYSQARESIDRGRYDRAIEQLDKLATLANGNRLDAALYWKSYALAKQGQRAEALATLADLQKRFADSRWLRDARALEVEVRQASGQSVSPDGQNDEELKLLALRGIMQGDPDRAVPMIERMLSGNSSVKLQENALFVLSQSRSAKAREIIAGIAKNGNPDLQLRAIRYLGVIGGTENRQILDEIYRSSTDPAIKRAIMRSFMTAGDRARLLSLAQSESSVELRGDAVQQLGIIHATAELGDLYQSESSVDVRKRILQAMFIGGAADRLIELAKTERDPALRRTAIHSVGVMRGANAADALKAIYASDSSVDIRKEVIRALFIQQNTAALIDLARAEKDPVLKREIVQKLSTMKSKEATDYLLELLK